MLVEGVPVAVVETLVHVDEALPGTVAFADRVKSAHCYDPKENSEIT